MKIDAKEKAKRRKNDKNAGISPPACVQKTSS